MRIGKQGAGRRICIFGAGVVLKRDGTLTAEWVPGSLQHWVSDLSQQEGSDYHGNFNGELFERFERMCDSAMENYGSCLIVMDGAKYH